MYINVALLLTLLIVMPYPVAQAGVPLPPKKPAVSGAETAVMASVAVGPEISPPIPPKKPKQTFAGKTARDASSLYYDGHINEALKLADYLVRNDKNKTHAAWIAGLSSWRLREYKNAAAYFERAAINPKSSKHLVPAAAVWAARAHMRIGNHKQVSRWYKRAQTYDQTFYGLVATAALGQHHNLPESYLKQDQYTILKERFTVVPELVYAIIKQESKFNPMARNASSGAAGLMQILPSTASYVSGDKTLMTEEGRHKLHDPSTNLMIGQQYLKTLLLNKNVKGNLLYLLVAYNAGPGNLAKWKKRLNDVDDPLLFIETMPAGETRAYVERVLSNYWIYRMKNKNPVHSLEAVASGKPALYPGYDPKAFRMVSRP